jgi:hypothetical protein
MNIIRRRLASLFSVGDTMLALSLLAGLVVRLRMYFWNPSYWYDEAYLLINVMKRNYLELLGQAELDQVYPPLFAFAERLLYTSFGLSEYAMRLPALLANLLTLIVLAITARRLLPASLAWLPVALFAVSRHGLIHSCEVKHYAFDLLAQSLIHLVTSFLTGAYIQKRLIFVLLMMALFMPWFSFTAAFALGGTAAVLAYRACQTRTRGDWLLFVSFSLLVLVSGLALWFFHARTLQTPSLHQFWNNPNAAAYPNPNSVISLVLWPFRVLIAGGGYTTREMGLPLMFLSILGVIQLFRTNRYLAIHLLVLFFLAVLASYLGKYPLSERTSFFLVIGLLFSAVVGVQLIIEQFPTRRWLLPIIALTLLSVDSIWFVRSLVTPPSYVPFRQVFEKLETQRQPQDLVWVSHPEVYQVYKGLDAEVYSAQNRLPEQGKLGRDVRVWLIYLPGPYDAFTLQTQEQLLRQRYVLVEKSSPTSEIRVQRWEQP